MLLPNKIRQILCRCRCAGSLLVVLLLASFLKPTTIAATEVFWFDTLKSPIAPNRVLTRTDPNFLSGTPAGLVFDNTRNYVVFELLRDSTRQMPAAVFQMTANIEVSLWYVGSNPNGAASAIIMENLTLSCDSTSTNISDFRAFKKYSNALKMSIKVVSITSPQGAFPPYRVAMEIHTNKIYPFDCNTTVTALAATHNAAANRMIFTWSSNSIFADDYDLEWNFYELESTLGKKIQTSTATNAELNASFRFNATRITTTKTVDTLQTLYRNGYIIYRVRAARYRADGSREYSIWAVPKTAAIAVAHEANHNWQADFTFAEDAKRVAMIQYFDGTLRERQSVTYSIANRTTIASQTIYDFNGRPAVKTMPLPTLTDTIRYTATLATTNGTLAYSKVQFDSLNACGFSPVAMNNTALWSRYYSVNNPEKVTLKGALIPDAEGFHYTLTEFTADNTGRIKRQSGVGATFKMGGGKETKYFYGKPSQEELDRLFGTEVGYYTHYQKNMVQDPNGQLSVSYVDAHGRTIATALAGGTPTNTNLDTVTGQFFYKPALTRNILNNVLRGDSLVTTYSLLVTSAGAVRINYEIQPQSYNPACLPSTICYDCLYESRIQITDNCAGASMVKNKRNFGVVFDTTCTNLAVGIKDTLQVNLAVGEYVVTKILKPHRPAVDFYADHYLKQTNCLPNLTTVKNQLRSTIKGEGCFINCDSCNNLGTENQYITQYIASIDGAEYTPTADDTLAAKYSYLSIVENCKALCGGYSECAALKTMLEGDMSPGGQYGLYTLNASNNVIPQDSTSIFAFESGNYRYRQLTGGVFYKNEFGNADTVLINGVKKTPPQLTPNEFVTHWKPSWAAALVNKHPEYCYYEKCVDSSQCNTFDSLILEIDTYLGAVAAGVIDTNGVFLNDPCFPVGNPQRDSIFNWLYVNSIQDPNACTGIGAISIANQTAYPTGITFGKGTRADNDLAWQILRGMYLGYKYQLKSRWRAAACPNAVCVGNGQATCNGSPNLYKDKSPRFMLLDSLNKTYSIASLTAKAAADSIAIKTQCDSNCVQMADAWLDRLAPCALTPTQKDSVRLRLIAVCKGGCDQTHPYGASTTKNGVPSSLNDTTFLQALTKVIGAKTLCDTCHANLINFPGPYLKPVYVSPYNLKRKEDATCLYANLTAYETAYNAIPLATRTNCYPTFSDYLKLMSDVPLSTRDIDTLKHYFNPSNLSRNLPYEIDIPPYLDCNKCKTCADIQSLQTTFNATCPNNNTAVYWDKFARYANNQLGFMLSGEEYYRFVIETCAAVPPANVCVGQKLLCPRTYSGYVVSDTACITSLLDLADEQAQFRYDAMIDSLRQDFKKRYIDKCLKSLETLTLTDTIREYHYTLYYYDQAGNLVKTVPPAGVDTVFIKNIANFTAIKTARTNGTTNLPAHKLPSQYVYNTLNKVTVQKTPDADTAKIWYDRIGRDVVTRDGRQKPLKKHSYKIYDYLGRPIEVGEITKSGADSLMTDALARNPADLSNWLSVTTKGFITQTFYDSIRFFLGKPLGTERQDNLRNRVVGTTFRTAYNANVDSLYDYATHYSYDVTGNVKTLVQDIKELEVYKQRFKRIDYHYDQLSGKVNAVFYQRDSVDQFAHYYTYDADNRLTTVYTSTQLNRYYRASPLSMWRFVEASYDYYKHGPLARTELGTLRVQGLDYAYTLQGWLKGVNGILSNPTNDMGQDGLSTNASRKFVGRDAFGFSLNYFTNDYKAAGTVNFDPDITAVTKSAYYNSAQQLFNGNIRSMTVAIKKFGNANGYAYGYDQLNRIRKLDTWNTTTANGLPSTWTIKTNYQERVTYDPNGNIKSYTRNQQAGTLMDNLSYSYYAGTNQLQRVADAVAAASFTTDIDNQTVTNNYVYDGVGNLVKDTSEALNVTWSPYGKVLSTVRKRTVAPAVDIQTLYGYDALQNRIQKTYINITDTTRTYYIRDAQGNVMAVYQRRKDTVIWQEQHLYGSSRLGTWEPNQRLTPSVDTSKKWQIREGQKRYELTNHLGNVLVTVSDRRQGAAPVSQQFTYYEAVVITATDYYPFGLEMPGRTFQSGNYRYGFNGKENDRNGSWSGNQLVQDYGFRLYNPAIGRFLSVDPLANAYPWLTPFQFGANSPIWSIDIDGLESNQKTDPANQNSVPTVDKGMLQELTVTAARVTYNFLPSTAYPSSTTSSPRSPTNSPSPPPPSNTTPVNPMVMGVARLGLVVGFVLMPANKVWDNTNELAYLKSTPIKWKVNGDILTADPPYFSPYDVDLREKWDRLVKPFLGKTDNNRQRTFVYWLQGIEPLTSELNTLKCRECNGSGTSGMNKGDIITLLVEETFKFGTVQNTDKHGRIKYKTFDAAVASRYAGKLNFAEYGIQYSSDKPLLRNVKAINVLGGQNTLPNSIAKALEAILVINYQINSALGTGGNQSLQNRGINTNSGLPPGGRQ
jgi:RHS repeat-associated protein